MTTLKPLSVLLTNDDGYSARGLEAVAEAFSKIDNVEVFVVAPDRERSTCSHGMSLARPVFVTECGKNRFAVDGLPVDCVYLAAFGLLSHPPDIVVSGINHGPNLGTDVIFSGTVAAARQAALQGIHGIAASLLDGDDFTLAAEATVRIAMRTAALKQTPPLVLNLNFPSGQFDGPRFAPLGERNYPRVTSKRVAPLTGQRYFWLGGPAVEDGEVPGSDGWLVKNGIASATLLNVNQTDDHRMGQPAKDLFPDIIEPKS